MNATPHGWLSTPVVPGASTASIASILDGTRNTLCVSETLQGMDWGGAADLRGFIHYGSSSGFSALLTPNSLLADDLNSPSYCANQSPNPPCEYGGGSPPSALSQLTFIDPSGHTTNTRTGDQYAAKSRMSSKAHACAIAEKREPRVGPHHFRSRSQRERKSEKRSLFHASLAFYT